MPNPFRGHAQPQDDPQLKKVLNSWQIFFITISGVVGTGLFSTNGGILSRAGPGGYILALGIVGMVAVCFMDGLSEMVQAFPCANALSEYVEAFVDPDLATCVGIGYWLVWGIFFGLMINGAAGDIIHWSDDITLRIAVMLILVPLAIIFLNLCSVDAFGWVETIGGSLKVLAVVGVSLALFYLAGESGNAHVNMDRGFLGRNTTDNIGYNVCATLPMMAYSWIGLEIVAVAAYESKQLKYLKTPSQAIVIVVFVLYLICAIGECLAIGSDDSGLPGDYVPPKTIVQRLIERAASSGHSSAYNSTALIVLTALQNAEYTLAGLFNGVLVFCAISAGNTSLYVASRALYGFALKKKARGYVGMDALSRVNRYGVPWIAVIVTSLAFVWIPFLQLLNRPAGLQNPIAQTADSPPVDSNRFAGWLGTVASLLGLIIWNTQFIAYIRYWHWLNIYKNSPILTQEFPELNRFNGDGRAQTLLGFAQPGVAYVGFTATFVIVFVFSSATWWQGKVTAYAVTETFAAPILMLAAWLTLKAFRYRNRSLQNPFEWYAHRKPGVEGLREVLNDMKFLSGEAMSSGAPMVMRASRDSPPSESPESKSIRGPSLELAPMPAIV